MSWRRPAINADVAVAHVLLILGASQIATREWYHQVAAEPFGIVLLCFVWMMVVVGAIAARWWVPLLQREVVNRVALMAVAAVSGYWIVGGSVTGALDPRDLQPIGRIFAIILLAVVVAVVLRSQATQWALFRRLLLVSAVLFVGSQPILTRILANDIDWPESRGLSIVEPSHHTATIFLLLDELNAGSAEPLVKVLRDHGLKVRSKAITPVGDGTAKVIPAMFTGRSFDQARPCGITAICSGKNVLDFSRVFASRADIDVIGFFHPYCAIQGLRWCHHVGVSISFFEMARWRCAAWRRFGMPIVSPAEICDELHGRDTNAIADELIQALWRAPVWRRGGFLYAHLPLPHPPGTSSSSLQREYRENLDRAGELLRQMLVRARQGGLEDLRVVIFSDHPLRQAMWCKSYFPYARKGCVIDSSLEDTMVPLIVAGDQLPDIDAINNNGQVFGLAGNWQ